MNLRLDSLITRWRTVQFEPEWRRVKTALDHGSRQVPSELRMLLRFVESLRPDVVMEIGTHLGGTFWAFKQVMNPEGTIVSLDIPTRMVDIPERTKRLEGDRPRTHFLYLDSHDANSVDKVRDVLGGKKIDFLFIDGGHLYESVRMDYEMYSPLVRMGGWIGFHDINIADYKFKNPCAVVDVNRYWNELDGFKIELSLYENSCGIGLLRKD